MTSENPPTKNSQPPLLDNILQYGKLALDPDESEQTKKINKPKFVELLNSTGTLSLMPALNLLVQPGRAQPWLRPTLIQTLALLPLRPRGVQNTIEFILSVHPSSASSSQAATAGRGSNISLEALNAASKLLSSPPKGMLPEEWFNGIAPQLISLLDGEGEPGMEKAAAYVIGFGILGRRQYGAPGSPGWKAFVEPMLRSINPTLGQHIKTEPDVSEEYITSLGTVKILTSSKEVAEGLCRLVSLVTSHPHPALSKRLLQPILLPLWAISSWPNADSSCEERYCKPARSLLKTYVQLTSSDQPASAPVPTQKPLTRILQSLMFRGISDPKTISWVYSTSKDGGIQIQNQSSLSVREYKNITLPLDLSAIDHASKEFVGLLELTSNVDEISNIFLDLCNRWLVHDAIVGRSQSRIQIKEEAQDDDNAERSLIEAKVMQTMMDIVPDKLVSDSRQVLLLVSRILDNFNTAQDGRKHEEAPAIALSLLNLVLTSTGFRNSTELEEVLDSIKDSLLIISKKVDLDISSTARNMILLLKYRNSFEDSTVVAPSDSSDRQEEDRKTYKLAMSYLTSTDAPPPVRVQGLDLLSKLSEANSPVIDVPGLLVLFLSLLQDNEEYIYLRVIQGFTQLSRRHPKSVMKELVERYADINEEAGLDARLRYGETLLRVVQSSSHAFHGDTARFVCEGLLSIASRRGKRPKTEIEQEKRAKLKKKQDEEAEEAWDGPVPQLDEVLGTETSQDDELLSQIVSGWESKRGTEDVRVRASALSILGSAIELNVSGIGSTLIAAAVDLSIHITTLEPEPEKGILRRSAVLLIMSLTTALESARMEGRKVGFGFVGQSLDDILRILNYVEGTDNDGLVRQHAQDVIESLQAWQINGLTPAYGGQMGIHNLAGLSVTPNRSSDEPRLRPRIEEIE